MKNNLIRILSFFICSVVCICLFPGIVKGRELVVKSSAVFSSTKNVEIDGVAVDSNDNIFIAGEVYDLSSDEDILIVKYDSNFVFITSQTFDLGNDDGASCIAMDSNNNVFVAGFTDNGVDNDGIIIKCDNNLVLISSKTYDGGNDDYIAKILVDSFDHVVVGGSSNNGTDEDFLTMKYGNDLSLYYTKVEPPNTYDQYIHGMVLDEDQNIIVIGRDDNGTDADLLMIKYDKYLNLLSSYTYNSGLYEEAFDVEVDSSGDIFILGIDSIGNFIKKYNSSFNLLLTERINEGMLQAGDYNMASDLDGNIFVTRDVYNDYFDNDDYMITKYNNDLEFVTFSTFDFKEDLPTDIITDNKGHIIVTGVSNDGLKYKALSLKYYASIKPLISSISKSSEVSGESTNVTIIGSGFLAEANVVFSGYGITVDSVTVVNNTTILATITIAENANLGFYDLTIVNTDGQYDKKESCFEIKSQATTETDIDRYTDRVLTLNLETGIVTLDVLAETFYMDTKIVFERISAPKLYKHNFKETNIGIGISVLSGESPKKDISLKIPYRDSDIVGFDETKLIIARYDTENQEWIPLESTVDTVNNYVTANLNHLSIFALVEYTPEDITQVDQAFNLYPNPYYPSIHGNIKFSNLTQGTKIKIFTIAGELVCELTEGDSDGILTWDSKNSSGYNLASGVYIAYIKNETKSKTMKFAIIK